MSQYAVDYLTQTSATFDWVENRLWAIGNAGGSPISPGLYSYYNGQWHNEAIHNFFLYDGACLTFVPNASYDRQLFAVPGFLYCLQDANQGYLWRYSLATSLPNVTLDGIYPGQGAVIADATPLFEWGSAATPQFRLLVSTDSLFTDTVLDEVVSNPEYQTTTALANGTYHWRTAAWVSSAWSWSGRHDFEIDAGWTRVGSYFPEPGGTGAAMVYGGHQFPHPALFVLAGNGRKDFWEYNLTQNQWTDLGNTRVDVIAGTSIVTDDACGGNKNKVWVAFGGSDHSDNLQYYAYGSGWTEWDQQAGLFPQWLGPGASMAWGPNDLNYLIVGQDQGGNARNDFYSVDPPLYDGGLASAARPGDVRSHVISRFNDIEAEYQLPASACVRATLHDAVGRQVGALDFGEQTAGTHRLGWSRDSQGRKLNAGTYFVLLDMGTERARLKAIVR